MSPVVARPPAYTVSGAPSAACATNRLSTDPNTGPQSKRVARRLSRCHSAVRVPYAMLCMTSVAASPHTRHAIAMKFESLIFVM